jgi:hypothetical protein
VKKPTKQAVAYISFRNKTGISLSNISRITPPAQAVQVPNKKLLNTSFFQKYLFDNPKHKNIQT